MVITMKSSVSEAIRSDPILEPRVRRATQMLEQVTETAVADWDLVRNANNRPMVLLVLTDFTGARVEAKFDPAELNNENHLNAKFYRIWGDLLQRRSHQQLNQLSGRIDAPGL
jgi:hypothetical protein